MPCSSCTTVPTIQIRSPSDLTKAIRHCKAMVSSGVLVQSAFWPAASAKFTLDSWPDIPELGGWQDILQYFFACAKCGQLYSLEAETYHGGGGHFGRYEASA